MPLEQIKKVSEEIYKEVIENDLIFSMFIEFSAAKNLGITFSPKDIDYDTFESFTIIQSTINEIRSVEKR